MPLLESEFTIALMLPITFIYMLQEVETTAVCVEIVVFVTSHDHGSLTADVGVVSKSGLLDYLRKLLSGLLMDQPILPQLLPVSSEPEIARSL